MIHEFETFLEEHAAGWGLPPSNWSCLLYNNYQPHYNAINLFWFHKNEGFPKIICKLQREPLLVKREFENLGQVYSRVPSLVARPLHFGLVGGFWSFWVEGRPGRLFPVRSRYSATLASSICDAVIALHRGLRQPHSASADDRYQRVLAGPLEQVERFGASTLVKDGCQSLLRDIPRNWFDSLPVIPQHGDLAFGNVLVHRRHCYIIDWESFGGTDLPLYDLLTFFLSLIPAGRDQSPPAAFRFYNQVPALVERYSKAFGLDSAGREFFLPLTLANWFYVLWSDGRREVLERMYHRIEAYFARRSWWDSLVGVSQRRAA
jgi:hypothetical protein